MDKFKYQIICILICLSIGLFIGHFTHSKIVQPEFQRIEKEKAKLKHQVDSLLRVNDSIKNQTKHIDSEVKSDSIKIKRFSYKIEADGVRVKKELDSVDKLSSNEKIDWLVRRYSPKH